MKTNKKGISLIVLAITIIVMIILASAIILSLSGKNMIGTAKEATSANDIANAKQAVSVAVAEWEMGERDGKDSLKEYAEAKLLEGGFNISGNGGFNVTPKGNIATIYIDEDGYKALIPEGYVTSEATGEDKISTGLVIYEGTEPVTDKNVKDAREQRNQYVWVPVDDISTFERVEWGEGTAITNTTSYNLNDENEKIEYAEMYESVRECKGFYIGRYEAGLPDGKTSTTVTTTDEPVSKKNATVWVNINRTKSKEKCEILSTDTTISHLIYGEEWDAALTFIYKTDADYATSSANKGNHTGSLLKTGSSDDYAVNNIYDMAGNVWEWSMERRNNNNYPVTRGGYFGRTGNDAPAASRSPLQAGFKNISVGFRTALYLK